MVAVLLDIRNNEHDETWKSDGMQEALRRLALPCPALQWQQHDSECIFVTLEVYFTTFFCELFCFTDFFGTERYGHSDGHTHGHMNRHTFLGKYYFR